MDAVSTAGALHELLEAQEGLWLAQQLAPANPLFNTGQFIALDGPLDLDAFTAAHAEAMAEAEALRLRIQSVGGAPRQSLDGEVPALEVVDLTGDPDGEAAARRDMDRDSAAPTDPARDPLAAFRLYRLSPTRHLWYERIHHLAIDGFGMVLLTNRVAALYSARMGQSAGPALAPYSAALEADRAYRAGEKHAADRAFWLDRADRLSPPASPSPNAAGVLSSSSFLRLARRVPDTICTAITERAKRLRLTWPDVLTSLSAAYLRRVSPDGDAVFGLPFMARFGSRAARVPCMWMNVLPHAPSLPEASDLDAALREDAAEIALARRHGAYRSERLRREIGRRRVDERLYGPLINVQPYDVAPQFHGLESRLNILSAGPVDDLTVSFRGDGKSGLTLEIDANPALYSEAEIAGHLSRLLAFLERAARAARLEEVPTVTEGEHARLIQELNATDQALDEITPETTLTALIEAQMARSPEAPAVRFGETVLSYAELDRRSRALAERLVALGAGADQRVAVLMDRSEHLAVALVAIQRAGAAYVPMDPGQPPARIEGLLAQTTPIAILADAPPGFRVAPPVLTPAEWPDAPTGAPLPPVAPNQLSYVLFTSGSTGAPKGVMIEHRAIVNRLLWMREAYGFTADDRILQKTPTSFDVSVWELFLPYLCGACLVFAPPGSHRDPKAIARLIRDDRITTCHFVPSMLAAFLGHPESEGITMRRVFCSGEELTPDHRDLFHARIDAELHNLYGPTEASVDVTFWPAGPEDRSAPMPIGWPVWNTRCYILDGAMRPVPEGVAGQLYLGGVQLARGYLGRDDLTGERFLPDPFRPGARIYATGDMARRRGDGAILYLGRNDHQVKIRGMRVELGEIEAALRGLAGVREAVVIARDDPGQQRLLVGYVVAGPEWTDAALRAALAQALPAHMVPARIVPLERMPTTANGKLDRKALPKPALSGVGGTPPRGETEELIAEAFVSVLRLPEPPVREADFFALGGDSLSALDLILRLEERLGRAVPLGQLFETPQIAALARAVETRADALAGLGPVFPLVAGREGGAPVVLLHPAGGLCWGYRALAKALSASYDGPIFGLQSPVLTGAAMPERLVDLSRRYADEIIARSDADRVHLVGWSLGGILAQDLAVELSARGVRPGTVALLDAYPAEVWRDEPEPDPMTALRALLAIAGFDPEGHPELDDREKLMSFLKRNSRLLGALPGDVLDAVVTLVTGTKRLMRAHQHRHYAEPVIHIRAAADHAERGFVSDLWAPHCAALEACDLDCLHKDMVAPEHVGAIAAMLAPRG
ncbi:non-ribosomal peptide synthetase [Poseidonocella sedimentorum]|uniref:Enterobactin synthetase component F n=1 Tax=Poseidonocella sedimentorum TaxID=871652 RepID=A0A1I6E4U1_9RHOB|nr:non-ribosomal peptide synthetase [Poseidonocella sedimentorum]SFR12498.1 enterobactin synthetase component F [Poseidonocella sedimentorum]